MKETHSRHKTLGHTFQFSWGELSGMGRIQVTTRYRCIVHTVFSAGLNESLYHLRCWAIDVLSTAAGSRGPSMYSHAFFLQTRDLPWIWFCSVQFWQDVSPSWKESSPLINLPIHSHILWPLLTHSKCEAPWALLQPCSVTFPVTFLSLLFTAISGCLWKVN